MEYVIGVDDAGRGPVIGPMVLAGLIAKETDLEEIKNLGAKDSKLLTSKKREEIAKKLKEKFEYHAELTFPKEIDEHLQGDKINLNDLEAIKTAMVINKLAKNKKENVKVIIDCPSTNIRAWTGYLNKFIEPRENNTIEIKCEHKADLNHVIVGAASIIAKTTRDAEIEKLKKQIGKNFGSGYPSDPNTVKFLEENYEELKNSDLVRKSWQTWKNLEKNSGIRQKKLF